MPSRQHDHRLPREVGAGTHPAALNAGLADVAVSTFGDMQIFDRYRQSVHLEATMAEQK